MTASPRRSAGPAWPTRWRSSPAKGCGPRPSRPTPPRGCRRAGLDQPRATRGLDPDHPAVPRRPHRDLVGGRRPAARGRLGPGPAPAAAGRRGSPSIPHHCRRQTTRPPLARPCGGSGPVSHARQPVLASWPVTLRRVRGWLTPWVVLGRCWRAWSTAPPCRTEPTHRDRQSLEWRPTSGRGVRRLARWRRQSRIRVPSNGRLMGCVGRSCCRSRPTVLRWWEAAC